MTEKHEYCSAQEFHAEKGIQSLEKARVGANLPLEETDLENAKIEAVRLVLPLPRCLRHLSIYFVSLASYAAGTAMACVLPTTQWTLAGRSFSLNPGPFNIKEHALIGIAVSTASTSAYAIEILAAMDLFLHHRINALGAIVLIITTQCLGYGMAGSLRKYLVYPAEMVWWSNLVQVVFYNAMHNTNEFKDKRMIRGWSYMKYFWVFCDGIILFYEFGGKILSYWIIFPILWMNNVFSAKLYGRPLTSKLYHMDGMPFDINPLLNEDCTVNEDKYLAGQPATMTPMYALTFMYSFVALAGCISHIACFHGADIWKTWKQPLNNADEDIHVKMMKVYPEVPQLWYAAFYVVMVGLSCMVCEAYGLLVAVALGWVLALPIGAMFAITGTGPGLNIITELVCGFMFPGKPIANMAFKCYGYMAMYQCHALLADLKLGVYMKIPPRSMFTAQIWGSIVGGFFNYLTMIVIISARCPWLDGTEDDPSGLWTGYGPQLFWGSALIYGALGPIKMFGPSSYYNFIY
ncbi:MAG: OPT oligopeptide transporter protein-domain-containing protein [Linnemannia gamsii]|nr:MAG: OPT oligopeptide transporter protein-domain-containing protein [Linnemannia gamsii]